MLLYPSVNKLQEKTDSRYSLCILTAKRARDIIEGKSIITEDERERPVSEAPREVTEDLVKYYLPA